MAHEEERIPVEAILGFLSATADEIGRRIARVEVHAASHLAAATTVHADGLIAIQDLDLIRQMAEDAARVAATAGEPRGRRRGALAAELRLAALRERLLGPAGGAPVRHDAKGPGPVELFSDVLLPDRAQGLEQGESGRFRGGPATTARSDGAP